MNHQDMKERIFEYLDGEVPTDGRRAIEAHLPRCPECRTILDGWRQTKANYLDPLSVQPSKAFIANVMRDVRSCEAPESSMGRFLKPLFSRWAFPALSLSVAGFTMALLYAVQPVNNAEDGLVLGDQARNVTAEWKNGLADDQIVGLLVNKP